MINKSLLQKPSVMEASSLNFILGNRAGGMGSATPGTLLAEPSSLLQ